MCPIQIKVNVKWENQVHLNASWLANVTKSRPGLETGNTRSGKNATKVVHTTTSNGWLSKTNNFPEKNASFYAILYFANSEMN